MNSGKSRLGQLLAIFALSGFSGLIYQSIWSHYLGLTLGHAAYAQTLVLAIFMGGLALGSWLASRWISNLRSAVLAYAVIEAVIGVLGLLFHPGFVAYTGFSQETALPALSGDGLMHAWQWGTAALLILPQCVLLGMTFPLLASACLRIDPQAQGRTLGGLYFTNSFGAAIGALVATFVLLPAVGMPGAMMVAGAVNLVVAALAWWLSREPASQAEPARSLPQSLPGNRRLLAGVLGATAITGATSFVYEVVWVRMLNMALGTTLHSFELMLAAFILGLAAGGYWIHKRGERIGNTLWLAGVSQVLMGMFALASAFVFGRSFYWVGWLMNTLPHTDSGYGWFNLGSAGIALLVMFPTAFFAGSTLPLFTMSLLRRGEGEVAVGRVYAANTVGAIVGVFAVVHLLIPGVGLHLSLLFAAALDIALGGVLLAWSGAVHVERDKRLALLAGAAMLAVALMFGRTDPLLASSGVYRTGRVFQPGSERLKFMADGKTATVSVLELSNGRVMTIATNGKPDAGMTPDIRTSPVSDEVTMVLLGALPLVLHENPRDVAAIGWGSGLTTHTVLGSPQVRRVETVEIEPAMVRGARAFGDRVQRAYADPRSVIVYEDARTYFATGRKQYDVLISEPSNPWVSGVASLFTDEFYGFSSRHLKPGGMFVQWLQSYEISDPLQARIIAALLGRFRYVDAYLANSSDLVLVASSQPLPRPDARRLAYAPVDAELARVGLPDSNAFAVRRLGGRKVLEAYVRMNDAGAGHSDFYPEVALRAPRDRFTDENANLLPVLALNGLPVLDMVDGRRLPRLSELVAWDSASTIVQFQRVSGQMGEGFRDPAVRAALAQGGMAAEVRALERVLAASRAPIARDALPQWSADLAVLARYGPGALATEDLGGTWIDPAWLAPGQGPEVRAVMAAYRAAARRDAAAMRASASAVLALDAPLAAEMRHQMLAIAMLGAIGQADPAGVHALERDFGAVMPKQDQLAPVRRFLLASARPVAGLP